ncbi:hypothetical protein MKW94_026040 [Papaver nudicaule]|uniref:Uncharacterized protein n=1 Tax=Papaver nudicaule TaxID=74823 RepID=A0AA41S6L4_PAPNU|nr:hypothetical protein [Papaver nudicaule]
MSSHIKLSDHGARKRQRLLELRDQLRHLLQDWKPFLYVRNVISSYVNLLSRSGAEFHKTRSDILVDLGILKELLPKLEKELAESKKDYFHKQLLSVYAHRRKSMMLRVLHKILGKEPNIPDDFRKWIKEQLVDTDWDTVLQFTNDREEELMKRAFVNEIQLKKQTINVEPIDAGNPDLVKNWFLVVTNICFLYSVFDVSDFHYFGMISDFPSTLVITDVHGKIC